MSVEGKVTGVLSSGTRRCGAVAEVAKNAFRTRRFEMSGNYARVRLIALGRPKSVRAYINVLVGLIGATRVCVSRARCKHLENLNGQAYILLRPRAFGC